MAACRPRATAGEATNHRGSARLRGICRQWDWRSPCSSQATDGKTWIPLASGLAGGSYELQVPNLPTKSAKLKLERTVPYSVTITSGFFTIAA
jgi:hypothetical protein